MLNKFAKKAVQMAAGLFVAGLTMVQAQSGVRAVVPFEFEVQGVVMPAGSYRLDLLGNTNNLMQLSAIQGKVAVLLGNTVQAKPQAPGLSFAQAADGRMVLTAVARGGGRNSLELLTAKKRLREAPAVAKVNIPFTVAAR